jgi:hypothetical protein
MCWILETCGRAVRACSQADDSQVVVPILSRLTNTADLPIVLLGGKTIEAVIGAQPSSVKSGQTNPPYKGDIQALFSTSRVIGRLHSTGTLKSLIQAVVSGTVELNTATIKQGA